MDLLDQGKLHFPVTAHLFRENLPMSRSQQRRPYVSLSVFSLPYIQVTLQNLYVIIPYISSLTQATTWRLGFFSIDFLLSIHTYYILVLPL